MLPVLQPAQLGRELAACTILGAAVGVVRAFFPVRGRGASVPDALLTGLETRTSSPVRLPRDENGESTDVRGVWPCGEGPGYAGGIMSAAVDGLRAAARVAQNFSPAP